MMCRPSQASMLRSIRILERAHEIDPEAFEPFLMPTFTEIQKWRQTQAMMQASKEENENATIQS